MTTHSSSTHLQRADAIWIPFGFVFGSALGSYFGDGAMGMSLGLLAGAALSMAVDYRRGSRGIAWPIVGGFAFAWTAVLFLIERA